jgi:hypothetical protein
MDDIGGRTLPLASSTVLALLIPKLSDSVPLVLRPVGVQNCSTPAPLNLFIVTVPESGAGVVV